MRWVSETPTLFHPLKFLLTGRCYYMNRMPVALFGDHAKAEAVRKRLAEAGFNAQIVERPSLTWLWFVAGPGTDMRIEVQADQFERAEQRLLDWESDEGALSGAVRCPECGSLRVDYPQYARHSLITNLALGVLSHLHVVERDYYCEDCHYTWPKEGILPRANRHNLAPYYFIEGVEQTTLPRTTHQPDRQEPKAA